MSSPPTQIEAEYQLDPLGDITLVATSPTEPERHLRASCKTLCLASSVFKAMIGPDSSFSEKRSSRINLVDDNFDALLLVLRAAHLRSRLIPFNISAEKLFHIAVVCDKYDLTDSVTPWAEIWIRNFKDVAQTSRYDRWLRISWVFQRATIFEKVTRRLILETEFDLAGNLVTEGGESFAEGIPDTVIGTVVLPFSSFR
jgi:hypothetical protein